MPLPAPALREHRLPSTRVAITGMGVICALGHNVSDFWSALVQGRSAIAPMQLVDASIKLRFQNGAEVRGYDPAQHFESSRADLLDRFAQFAVVAAREAVRQSGIEFTSQLREQTAVITGSCVGGQTTQDNQFVELYRENRNR